jgi:hypothetical protein
MMLISSIYGYQVIKRRTLSTIEAKMIDPSTCNKLSSNYFKVIWRTEFYLTNGMMIAVYRRYKHTNCLCNRCLAWFCCLSSFLFTERSCRDNLIFRFHDDLFSVYYYLSMINWQEYLELKSRSCCHGILVVRLVPRNHCQIMSASWNLKMRLSLHDLSVNRKELRQQNQARHLSQISEPDQLLNHNIWISKTCTLIYHSLMFQTLHFIWSENNKEWIQSYN